MRNLANTVVLEIPANLEYVHILGRCACALLSEMDELCEADSTLYNLELAIQEIGVNIITHAYACISGRVTMYAALDNDLPEIHITLEDTGQTFEPQIVPTPKLGTLQEHGYGLFLAHEILDDVRYEVDVDKNRWHLKKNLHFQKRLEEVA